MKNLCLPILLLVLLAAAFAAGCGDDDDDNDDVAPHITDDDSAADDDADDDFDDDIDDDADDDIDDDIDDDVDDDTLPDCDWRQYDPLIEAGKDALAAYDPATAAASFDSAFDVCPEIADAKMGALLAGLQSLIQSVSLLTDLLATFPDIDWVALQQTIRDQLMPLNEPILADAAAILDEHPDARFFISELPLMMDGDYVVIDAAGEWDAADVLNVSAIADLADAVEHLLIALDLDANWALVATMPGGYDPVVIAHEIAGNVLAMFADSDHPDFLTFVDGGEEDFAQGAISMGFASLDGAEGFDAVCAETDPQEDDVTAYVDENTNGQWDEGEVFRLPYLEVLSPVQNRFILDALAMMDDLGPAMLDSGPEDLHPIRPDWLPLDDLNFILGLIASYVPGLSLPAIPVPVGYWFYYPSADGLRSAAQALAQLLYDLTAP